MNLNYNNNKEPAIYKRIYTPYLSYRHSISNTLFLIFIEIYLNIVLHKHKQHHKDQALSE